MITQEKYSMSENEKIGVRNTNSAYLKDYMANFASATPLFASSTAGMTDTTRLYCLTTTGYLYHYVGGAWVSTGVLYQGTGVLDGSVTNKKLSFKSITEDKLYNQKKIVSNLNYQGHIGNVSDLPPITATNISPLNSTLDTFLLNYTGTAHQINYEFLSSYLNYGQKFIWFYNPDGGTGYTHYGYAFDDDSQVSLNVTTIGIPEFYIEFSSSQNQKLYKINDSGNATAITSEFSKISGGCDTPSYFLGNCNIKMETPNIISTYCNAIYSASLDKYYNSGNYILKANSNYSYSAYTPDCNIYECYSVGSENSLYYSDGTQWLKFCDYPIDVAMSSTSENAIQNKVVYAELQKSIKGDTTYGGTILTNLNTIEKTGFYTCYGTATGIPNSTYSWFVEHINSNVNTASATQIATAYNSSEIIKYLRVKTLSIWGEWKQIKTWDLIKTYVDGNKITTIVNTPVFTNQPTYTGAISSDFDTTGNEYYYVANVSGNTFQLTSTKNGTTYIGGTFTLTGLDTGNSGTLSKNTIVEFNSDSKMRLSYISRYDFTINTRVSKISIECCGKACEGYNQFVLNPLIGNNYISSNGVGLYQGNILPKPNVTLAYTKYCIVSGRYEMLFNSKTITMPYQATNTYFNDKNYSVFSTAVDSGINNGFLKTIDGSDIDNNVTVLNFYNQLRNGSEIKITYWG